jgi:hypothetical protein
MLELPLLLSGRSNAACAQARDHVSVMRRKCLGAPVHTMLRSWSGLCCAGMVQGPRPGAQPLGGGGAPRPRVHALDRFGAACCLPSPVHP